MSYDRFNSSQNQGNSFRENQHRNTGGGGNSYNRNEGGYSRNNDNQRPPYQKGNSGYGREGGNEQDKPLPEPYYYKAYAVCSSGELPLEIHARMRRIVKMLEKEGLTVRYSHGEKSDELIEETVTTNKELHLPWKKFGEKEGGVTFSSPETMAIAKDCHGAWGQLSDTVHKFLARTVRLLMGEKARSPALFLLTYTEDGCENIREKTPKTGYMGFPIQVASKAGIPVFNIFHPDVEDRLRVYLGCGSSEPKGRDEDFDSDDM